MHYTYGEGTDDLLSRVAAIQDDDNGSPGSPTFASYKHNGVGRLVVEKFDQPGVELDYYGSTPDTYAGFDRFGRITQQRWHQSGGDKDKYLYVYDYNSNRTHKDNTTTTGLDEVYTYDKLDRLTGYDRGTLSGSYPTYAGGLTDKVRNEAWTLSPTGNWNEYKIDYDGDGDYEDQGDLDQDRTHNKANEIYDATPGNAITELQGQSAWADPVHDPRGNMTTIPRPASMTATYACTYDAWNRLVEVKHGQTTIGRYEYDGLGRRIRKQIDTQAPANPNGVDTYRHFYYNASWQIVETRKTATESAEAENLQPEYQYVWSARYIDAPVLRDENRDDNGLCDDEGLFYLTDVNMNVTALVETDGEVAERYAYDPYGRARFYDGGWTARDSSSYANAILYCGYYRDAETGLYHVRNRMYHPLLGRWLQRDPLGYVDGMSLYEYVGSRPLLLIDPLGLGPQRQDIPAVSSNMSSSEKYHMYRFQGRCIAEACWFVAIEALSIVVPIDELNTAGWGNASRRDVLRREGNRRPRTSERVEAGATGTAKAVATAVLVLTGVDYAAPIRNDGASPQDKPKTEKPKKPALPEDYWKKKKAPTQVEPGKRRITDQKPSSRKEGEIYERTTHYDEYGRQTGQTHKTDHGEPEPHPKPHHHERDPVTGQETGPRPGVHPDYEE